MILTGEALITWLQEALITFSPRANINLGGEKGDDLFSPLSKLKGKCMKKLRRKKKKQKQEQ